MQSRHLTDLFSIVESTADMVEDAVKRVTDNVSQNEKKIEKKIEKFRCHSMIYTYDYVG